jgi:hypothetical protein
MKTLDKKRVDQEYTEAIQELQGLYDDLFYEELKEKIAEILVDLQKTRQNLDSELRKSGDSTRGFLSIVKEDLASQINSKHKEVVDEINLKKNDVLKEISQWLFSLNEMTTASFNEQSTVYTEQNKQVTEKVESIIHSFDSWKVHLNKRMGENVSLLGTHIGDLKDLLKNESNAILTDFDNKQRDLQNQVETFFNSTQSILRQMEESRVHDAEEFHQKEELTKKELEQFQQQLAEVNEQSKKRLDLLEKKLDEGTKFTKKLLYGLIGTQIAIIIAVGALVYFT